MALLLLACLLLLGGWALYSRFQDSGLPDELPPILARPMDHGLERQAPQRSGDAEALQHIQVRLGPVSSTVRAYMTAPLLDGVALWPDDFELPDLATTKLVGEILFTNERMDSPVLHDALEVAAREGVTGDVAAALESPGRAFLEMETARLRAEHSFHHTTVAWATQHLAPGEELASQFGSIWRNAPDRPVQDFEALEMLAESVEAAYPGHEVADYARLYLAISKLPKGMRAGRDAPDVNATIRAIMDISDPTLAELGATVLTEQDRWIALPDQGHDALAAIETTSAESEVAISEYLLDQAVAAGDWRRAATLMERYRSAVARFCTPEVSTTQCELERGSVQDAAARVAAVVGTAASTWEEDLIRMAWDCYLNGAEHSGTATSKGSFDVGWRWHGWDAPSELTRCVEASATTTPGPPPGTNVRLTLERAAE